MALTDENGGGFNVSMPVAPAYGIPGGNYGNGLFGGGDSWLGILFLIALCNGGFGFGGFGGYGMGMMNGMWGMDGLYPWLNNSQNINNGFRDQQISTQINGLQNAVTSGFGDVQTALCGGFANVNQNVSNGFASTNLGIANGTAAIQNSLCNGFNGVNNSVFGAQTAISQQLNANEIANLNRSFAEQTANTAGFTNVNAGIADLRYTEATEGCATRTAAAQNTRDIIDAQTRGTQAILDKLCALELDGVKSQLAQAQRENVGLQNAVNMAAFRESQANQNALFAQGLTNEVDALYNRLKNCPVNTVPVAGNTPLFSCNPGFNNSGCGCGFGNGFAN